MRDSPAATSSQFSPSSPRTSPFTSRAAAQSQGTTPGHEKVGGFFQALGERSNGTFKIEVQDILDNGDDTVVALLTFVAQNDTAQLAMSGVHVWHVEDGKATSHQSFVADEYEWDEFWT
jgi:ketosteroid isomerase-like protein